MKLLMLGIVLNVIMKKGTKNLKMANVSLFVLEIKLGQIYIMNVITVLTYLVLYVKPVHYKIKPLPIPFHARLA